MNAYRLHSRLVLAALAGVLVFAFASALELPAATLTAEPTTTTLSSAPNPARSGEAVTMTADVTTVGGKIPTGSVNFYDGKKLLATVTLDDSGAATHSAVLAIGTHHLKAVYAGDKGFEGSTSNGVTENVVII
jgi:hypothetical protein